MIDLELIENTIEELENSDTNFTNCEKLASLYTVKEFYEKKHNSVPADVVEEEFHDILPQYKKYCEVKRRYQLGETTQQSVLDCLSSLCTEIEEFFHILYSSTDMPEEREQLNRLKQSL